MRHEFHPEAYAEYEEAARYCAERDPDVAARFIAAVEEAIERICDSPMRWRVSTKTCAAASRTFSPTVCSTPSKRGSSSSSRLCTAAVNPGTGRRGGRPNKPVQPTRDNAARVMAGV